MTIIKPTNIAETLDLYRNVLGAEEMENIFHVSESYLKICDLQKEIFEGVEHAHTLMRTYFFIVQGRRHGKETNVTSLAHFHGISRSSMLRRLRSWEKLEKITLVKHRNETVVYGYATALHDIAEYIDRFQGYFTPVHSTLERRQHAAGLTQRKLKRPPAVKMNTPVQ